MNLKKPRGSEACVWNIWKDVKLPMAQTWLIFEFLLLLRTCRGTQHFTGTVSNEATSEMGYPAWPAGRTCTIFQFRQWRPAKPSTGMSFGFTISIMDYAASEPSSELRCQQVSIHCTVFAIWFTADFVRWNSCFLQGQRKNSSTMVFSPSHPIFLSDFRGLFVHARCTPQQ